MNLGRNCSKHLIAQSLPHGGNGVPRFRYRNSNGRSRKAMFPRTQHVAFSEEAAYVPTIMYQEPRKYFAQLLTRSGVYIVDLIESGSTCQLIHIPQGPNIWLLLAQTSQTSVLSRLTRPTNWPAACCRIVTLAIGRQCHCSVHQHQVRFQFVDRCSINYKVPINCQTPTGPYWRLGGRPCRIVQHD